jgi:hypothetical protein
MQGHPCVEVVLPIAEDLKAYQDWADDAAVNPIGDEANGLNPRKGDPGQGSISDVVTDALACAARLFTEQDPATGTLKKGFDIAVTGNISRTQRGKLEWSQSQGVVGGGALCGGSLAQQ